MRCQVSDRQRPALYVGLGARLQGYAVNTEGFMLTLLDGLATLPANVQYACPHSSGRYLYVVSSNGGPGVSGDRHYVTSFRIDSETRALHQHGDHVVLRHRPIHIATDTTSDHVLIAYNNPSAITVHRIAQDGRIAAEVGQPSDLDTGIFAHQISVMPSNASAVLVTRGNDACGDKSEDPGALKIFNYSDGVLANRCSVAPSEGHGFGPRNIELDPSNRWIYVSLERQNRLNVFSYDGETIDARPSFECDTLADGSQVHPTQIAGAVHVHPSGRVVYVANRASGGGENTIAVYAIEEQTGRPHMIQSIDTQGMSPRTFSIDPTGGMLVTANSRAAPNLSVFSIGADGRLTHKRRYEVDSRGEQLFWSGMVW